MRILFTFVGGSGHLGPLLPVAIAAREAGHNVSFEGQHAALSMIEEYGFSTFGTGDDLTDAAVTELRPLDAAREDRVLRDSYPRRFARERATSTFWIGSKNEFDLIVCDEVDFGSMIAAERLKVPHVTVLVIAAGSFVRSEIVAESLDEIRVDFELSPDPMFSMPSRYLVLSPFPPSFRDPKFPLPKTTHTIQPPFLAKSETPPRVKIDLGADRPTVYFTLGTVFNVESGDLFKRVIEGLSALPIELVVTVGRQIDPDQLGLQPSNVHVTRFIDQSELLPSCDLVVSHGGSGSVTGALAHGLPLVVLPMGADQPHNARRCVDLGLGMALDPFASANEIGDVARKVLREPSYRQNAQRIQDEIRKQPGPETCLELLEQLVNRV